MLAVLNAALTALDAVTALPVAVVAAEIAAALPPSRRRASDQPVVRPSVAVLVPAHNEHETIAGTITAVRAQLKSGDRLLVVADNCTDDTAALARAAGAEVIERFDAVSRGKGFALDFGVRRLAASPSTQPGVVVIVDADVRPSPGTLDRLAAQAAVTGRPAQAVYLLRQAAGAHANPVSLLAFQVRNFVRPLGLSRLGGPCPLFGAGMAFPWALIENAPLASPHLTEDVALALDLACEGLSPRLCPTALIEGDSAPTAAASAKQRKRWEHGHLSLILSAAPRTLWRGITRGSLSAVVLACDVMVPPLSLLTLLVGAATAVTWLAALVGVAAVGLALAQTAVFAAFALAVLAAAVRFGEPGQRLRLIGQIVHYAAGKMPLYFGFVFQRQVSWERTDRAKTAESPFSRPDPRPNPSGRRAA